MCVVELLRMIVLLERDMAGSFEHERRWCVCWFCGLSCCVWRGCEGINRETIILFLKGRSETSDNEVILPNTNGAPVYARSFTRGCNKCAVARSEGMRSVCPESAIIQKGNDIKAKAGGTR